jgi:hypothetical protein
MRWQHYHLSNCGLSELVLEPAPRLWPGIGRPPAAGSSHDELTGNEDGWVVARSPRSSARTAF